MGRDLKLERLTKRYGASPAVDHVNLEIKEGEFICFLGPSGCGKTTVLRMITGFETVTEGSVIFNGNVINDLLPKKREFGIVFQSYALFPNMTVEENIAFGLKMRKMPAKAISERVDKMLDLIGLSDWRKLYPAQLSGGQQQRVALVRALAPDHPGPAPGRTAERPRREDPVAPAGGDQAAPAGAQKDDDPRHPRSGRGALDRRPGGGHGEGTIQTGGPAHRHLQEPEL